MTKGRRWASLLVLLVAFATIAASCGDDGEATTTVGGAAVTTTAADGGVTTTAADGGVTTTAADGGVTTTSGEMMVPEDFQIGMILVGPQNDRGMVAGPLRGRSVRPGATRACPKSNLIVLDKVNTADRPETTIETWSTT